MTEILNSPAISALWACIVLAIAAASVSVTLTQTELFAPIRARANKAGHMIGHLFHCFYCMSHWVVIVGIAVYRPVILSSGWLMIDLTVSTFFTVTLSAFFSGMILKVFLVSVTKTAKELEVRRLMSEKN